MQRNGFPVAHTRVFVFPAILSLTYCFQMLAILADCPKLANARRSSNLITVRMVDVGPAANYQLKLRLNLVLVQEFRASAIGLQALTARVASCAITKCSAQR